MRAPSDAKLTINTVLGGNDLLEVVVGLGTDLHGLSERRSASGDDHELLEGKLVAGVGATVDDVEAGSGEDEGGLDTGKVGEVLVEGDLLLSSGGLSGSDGNTEDGVGTELALVGGSVEFDQEIVDILLLQDGESGFDKSWCNDIVDVRDGLGNTCDSIRGRSIAKH